MVFNITNYWEQRYKKKRGASNFIWNGTSGAGSYGQLAKFKAQVLNSFITEHSIESVIDFGCGDGHQLTLTNYPRYIGLDVSPRAISLCTTQFANDLTKSFFLYDSLCFVDNQCVFSSDLAISLDVIYHLVGDTIYKAYMRHLFSAAKRFVIIYSSNQNKLVTQDTPHIQHREFTSWVCSTLPDWQLVSKIANPYPYEETKQYSTSVADFYVFQLQ